MNYYIGVDLGTSAMKLLLMDVKGDICNIVTKDYPLSSPHQMCIRDSITPAQARQLGIGAVYQEFTLVRDLPIVENMFMGNLIGNGVIVNKKKMVEEARKIFEDFGTDIDPNACLLYTSRCV